jgi:prepilin-type N-terminal cleavage/methylation domain-containing protein
MKKQSGFTLIELLLVLAIIGIISAIAIPALLGQRARARDKSSISNMEGRVGDLVGQYDKSRENALTSTNIKAALTSYLTNTGGADKNPWNTTGASMAFDFTIHDITGATTQSQAVTALKGLAGAGTKGQAHFGIAFPGAGTPGFMGGAVYVDNLINGSNIVTKCTAIE